ncbi:MAG: helix-hairpin-helix domain-containing protein [bacterium]|nr:helix-hairpin-helix domain-containing protein [bacterium]
MKENRKLADLVSVGPATLRDFEELGISEVEQLIDKDSVTLFERLEKIKGQKLDRCCEDVFRTAIEQARNPKLPEEKKQWYYWSRVRKNKTAK